MRTEEVMDGTETTEAALRRISKENIELQLRLHQAMGALGYPVPGHVPESDLKCGMCSSKEKDYQEKKIELSTMISAFKMLAESR
jgi:hypothetical protein